MERREFMGALGAGLVLPSGLSGTTVSQTVTRGTFQLDGHRVRFHSPAVRERVSMIVAADTHLFTDDARGVPYREFSGRMARAYNQTTHVETGAPTNPEESFERTLALAADEAVDLVALVGDVFSFPSEAAIEWVLERLDASRLPYVYTAGNHDWHYEGMPGSLDDLRATWIDTRLRPLYQGQHPLMAVRVVRGVRFITLDDSQYEILPEQRAFFRAQVATGDPLVLLMHIPLYAPGRSVGFGCGHPEWGAASDRNFELERRPRWPAEGHTETTRGFHADVLSAPNLLGVLCGHIHRPSLDVLGGVPQIVVNANAVGAYLHVEVLPLA